MTNAAGCSGGAGAAPAGGMGSCKGDAASYKAGEGKAGMCHPDCANCTAGKCEEHGCGMGSCKGGEGSCKGGSAPAAPASCTGTK